MLHIVVHRVTPGMTAGEGHGARVRRSIGRPELPNFDPFLMLDVSACSGR